jgi:hypothetical protein
VGEISVRYRGGNMKFKLISLALIVFLILVLTPVALADGVEDGEINSFCAERDGRRHPVGGRIADIYDGVDYSQVMTWFCDDHFGFGEILLALQASQLNTVDETPGELLRLKTELGGWGEVWKEIGFTGRPKEGRPAWAGPKDADGEGKPNGPPSWAGPKDRLDEEDDLGPPSWAGPKDKNKPNGKDKP